MSQIKLWPHMVLVGVLVAVVAGLGTALYFKHEQNVQAEALPNAARIQRVDGQVAFNDATYPGDNGNTSGNGQSNTQWVAATANQPFSVGDRIYTRENSHASLAFTGRNFARLNPNTELDVIDFSNNRTELALRDGSAIFDVGYLAPNELYEVGTPYGAVDFLEPGLYNVGYDNSGNVLVSALSGVAQVVGLGGSGRISKGEILTLAAASAAQAALSTLNRNDAGYFVDDYYRYQYPNIYDGRYSNYDAYLSDPFYYDPYRRSVSYQYASSYIPGLNDLDYYGDWQNVGGYGYAWRPRVDAGWVPYQEGYWLNDYPYGPTWVSSEEWGYAPYHYGRWVNAANQWYWVPDAVNSTPYYSPALVAFIPFSDSSQIGWVPLGPGDPYVPRYYDANWQPNYLTRTNIVTTQLVNVRVPNAVTVVPLDAFGRDIDQREVHRADMQQLAQVRGVLDPLTLTPLRNAVIHSAWGRGKIDLPPGIAKKLEERPVVVSSVPAPPFRKDLGKTLRVEQLPERVRNQQMNVRDERRAAQNQAPGQATRQAVPPADDAARREQMTKLAAEAARGNRDARQQMQQLEQEQRKQQIETGRAQRDAERAQRQTQQQAQGQRVGEPARRQPEREVMRPQQQVPRAQPEQRKAAPAPMPMRVERPQRPQQEQRRAAPQPQPQPRVRPEPRGRSERPQVMQQPQPQQRQQAQPRQEAQRPQPQPRQQAQPHQQAQQQQAAPKHEAKPGPPQKAEAPSKEGGGKGKGKKP